MKRQVHVDNAWSIKLAHVFFVESANTQQFSPDSQYSQS